MNRCPFCHAEGEVSRLYPSSASSSTLMAGSPGFYDEAGKWVPGHDPNTHTRFYSCSRGHQFKVKSRQGAEDEIIRVLPEGET